jgi:hypothetical protein
MLCEGRFGVHRLRQTPAQDRAQSQRTPHDPGQLYFRQECLKLNKYERLVAMSLALATIVLVAFILLTACQMPMR